MLRHPTLDFSKLLKVVQTLRQFQLRVSRKKLRFFQVQSLLKGIAAAGAVAGGAVATYTAQAEETTMHQLWKAKQLQIMMSLANSESVALSAAPVSETVASEAPASA